MYLLFTRINNLDIPLDLQLKLFDSTVVPILTYGSEVWGYENLDMIETVHNDLLRKITRSKKSTRLYMLLGELGRLPLHITIVIGIDLFTEKIQICHCSYINVFGFLTLDQNG